MKLLILIFISCMIIFVLRFHHPVENSAKNFITTGTIASLAESHDNYLQFLFLPENTQIPLVLRWYYPPPVHLNPGDQWMLHIKTKNQKGNVQMDLKNQLMERAHWKYPIDHIRLMIYKRLENTLSGNEGLGFISALTIGMRDHITENQWEDLRGTGTNHLMAIAGLHIGFISLIFYSIVNSFWRRSYKLMLMMPAQDAANIAALSSACMYSALAGFSLPTQRAIIMLSVFLLANLCRLRLSPWCSYLLALSIVLAHNPLCVSFPTFWLSFTAVGLLIYAHGGRSGEKTWWDHWTRAQWIMALGLIPLNLLFFQQIALIGFMGNCIAIPFVGFIILPLCLLGICWPYCWKIASFLLMHFWKIMHWLATLPHSQYFLTIHPNYLASLFFAVILLLAPKGFPHRWLGLLGFLPLFIRH